MSVDTPTRTLKAYATTAADECDWAQREVKSSSSGELSRADTHDPIQPNEFTHRSESSTLVADEDAPAHLSNEPPAQTHGGLELVNEESSVQEKSSSTGYDPEHIPILSAMREYFAERTETFLPEKSLVINTMAGKELKPPLSISTVCELRQWVAQECNIGTQQFELLNGESRLESDELLLCSLGPKISLSMIIVPMRDLDRIFEVSEVLYMLVSEGVISGKLPQVLALGKWADDFHVICPLEDEEGRKCVMDRLADCRRRALDTLVRMLPSELQAKPIDLGIPGIAPVLPTCTPALTWKIEDEAIDAEMLRQGCNEVDFLFCLEWHWHQFGKSVHPGLIPCNNRHGILCTNLRTYGESECSRSERALKALVLFQFLESIGFITAADGSATLFQSILKDTPREFQLSFLIAMTMIQEGFIDNSWGYGFKTWGNEANLANPKLLFQRIISLAPVTTSSYTQIGDGNSFRPLSPAFADVADTAGVTGAGAGAGVGAGAGGHSIYTEPSVAAPRSPRPGVPRRWAVNRRI
jgi:hypothetical protein